MFRRGSQSASRRLLVLGPDRNLFDPLCTSMGRDAQIDVRWSTYCRNRGARLSRRGQDLLHDERQRAHAPARVAGMAFVLGQIERGAADPHPGGRGLILTEE